MHSFREILRRWTATRYTRSLEAEVARLRAENRALLNSILGIAGVPPITVTAPRDQSEGSSDSVASREAGSGLNSTGVERLKNTAGRFGGRGEAMSPIAGPLRRRSWHQINQALELDSARKREQESAAGPELGIATRA